MPPTISPGQTGTLDWIVDASMVICLGGDPRATVFSTPNMILLMERAAREALRPHLSSEWESVGVLVNIEHLAGATIGMPVRGVARVEAVDGKRVHFEVQAWQGQRLIGRGQHTRAIVSLARMVESVEALRADSSHAQSMSSAPMSRSASSGSTASPPTASGLSANSPVPQLSTIDVSLNGPVATVRLNRPKSLNAVDTQMTADFEQLVAWLAGHEGVRVVLLTGAGTAFCAGDDVKELESLSLETARTLSWRQAEMYLAVERLPQVVIALVNGDALGAGCVAATAADFRLAAHHARFGMPEIRLGWAPGYGLAQLTALVGKARALEMCLTGQPISARQAFEWGLVSQLVPSGQLLAKGQSLAELLLKMPATALRETKRLIHLDEGNQPKVAYRADTEAYIRCLATTDAQEGIRAFAEKRTAKFTGP